MYSNELYHFGVKGMRWGVRKSPSAVGSSRKLSRKIEKNRRLKRQYKKDVSRIPKMSDKELDNRVNRLNKERELRKLERERYDDISNRKIPKRVANEVADILVQSGKSAAKIVLTGALVYAGRKLLMKYYGADIGRDIFIKKK